MRSLRASNPRFREPSFAPPSRFFVSCFGGYLSVGHGSFYIGAWVGRALSFVSSALGSIFLD